MRTLLYLAVAFTVHRVLIQVYPPYRERVRSFDQKMGWITVILVAYLVVNFIYIVFIRFR